MGRSGRRNVPEARIHESTSSSKTEITRPITAVAPAASATSINAGSQRGRGTSSSSMNARKSLPLHSSSARLRAAAMPGVVSTTYRAAIPCSLTTSLAEPSGSLSTTRTSARMLDGTSDRHEGSTSSSLDSCPGRRNVGMATVRIRTGASTTSRTLPGVTGSPGVERRAMGRGPGTLRGPPGRSPSSALPGRARPAFQRVVPTERVQYP